jgi:hypothetical protein
MDMQDRFRALSKDELDAMAKRDAPLMMNSTPNYGDGLRNSLAASPMTAAEIADANERARLFPRWVVRLFKRAPWPR